MNRSLPLLSVLVLVGLCLAAPVASHIGTLETLLDPDGTNAPSYRAIIVGKQTESERLATIDLQRYLAQVTGVVPTIVQADSPQAKNQPAVVVGTPETNSRLAHLKNDLKKLGPQGYSLSQSMFVNRSSIIFAAGAAPEGAVNAIYGLLRELGYGFFLGSEAVPGSLPLRLSENPIVRDPVFRVRGVLPWYNFLNSPTTWDPVDHRAFADQLIRMGANFVGFHTYDHEPFAAYDENGRMMWGSRLVNTSKPTWGAGPLARRDFGFGTDKLYADEYFGAATTFIPDNHEAVGVEQSIMRDALDYAKKRGLYTCLGFEVHGDPLNPEDRDVFLRRINRVLDIYPSLDYLWIWQPETQGAQGFATNYTQHMLGSRLQPSSPLPFYGTARRDIFERVVERSSGERPFFKDNEEGRVARANEGARLEQFGQLAYRALAQRQRSPKLIISGWGGDERLLSEEYYDGLDKLLPKDVVFSSLDHIGPRPRVDKIYNELPADRERWPIPWLENDGDQWHAQPWVHVYEGLVKDAHEGGSQGILGIHWRTREVEENFGYLVDYAWNPGLTPRQYFDDLARRCYAPAIAEEMARIHLELDALGYRWVGGAGQVECGNFSWGPGSREAAAKLRVLRDIASSFAPRAGASAARLKWLIASMDWTLDFTDAEIAAVEATALLAQAAQETPAQAQETARKALSVLDQGDLGRALQAYSRRLTTRGEYGVLATINTKAVVAWRNLREQALAVAGDEVSKDESEEWNPKPDILLPRLIASVAAGEDLMMEPIVLGGAPAWMHFRALGESSWRTQPLQENSGWVRQIVIPSSDLRQPGLEFGFSFYKDSGRRMAYGPVAVTVMPALKIVDAPTPRRKPARSQRLTAVAKEGKVIPIELEWNELPDASFYKVYRDGELVVETGVAMFPDIPDRASGKYVVEAWRDGKVIARLKPVPYLTPDRKVAEELVVETHSGFSGVWLSWPAAQSAFLMRYNITRRSADGEEVILKTVPARRDQEHSYYDAPSPGRWVYTVTPVSITGSEGKPVQAAVDFVPKEGIAPIMELPLDAKPESATVVGSVSFDETGANFRDGHIVIPHQEFMNLGRGMTLEFEFRADEISGIPVLLSHGAYQIEGWFVQILGGQLIVRAALGDAQGLPVQTGKWYKVRLVYDGGRFALLVNDEWMEQTVDHLRDIPSTRDLIIGQYDDVRPGYAFRGVIRNLRIYDEPLM